MGACVVDPATGEVIAIGANGPIGTHDPTAHAEIVALRAAATCRRARRARRGRAAYADSSSESARGWFVRCAVSGRAVRAVSGGGAGAGRGKREHRQNASE